MRLEILTEEKSMEVFLRGLLPRILLDTFVLDSNCFIHSHEGKSHLVKSIPRKMKAYPKFPEEVRVLIIHDQDSNDCIKLKNKLTKLCSAELHCLVRIACRELENWYLGDFKAIECVFPEVNAAKYLGKAKYRTADRLTGAEEIKKLSKEFSKTQTAREIGKVIDFKNNKSVSFNHFISGLQKLLAY
ncbi:MAG: DUF4276 family protein [Bacteroidales bacterium]|nr:DUF4276 family protein [Bacteroidales bacterium]